MTFADERENSPLGTGEKRERGRKCGCDVRVLVGKILFTSDDGPQCEDELSFVSRLPDEPVGSGGDGMRDRGAVIGSAEDDHLHLLVRQTRDERETVASWEAEIDHGCHCLRLLREEQGGGGGRRGLTAPFVQHPAQRVPHDRVVIDDNNRCEHFLNYCIDG